MEHSIAIIGVGPRGTYALDFLTRALSAFPLDEWVDIHLIEPGEFGPGTIYRTSQPAYLLMNTVASQLSAFADERLGPSDPFAPGKPMYAWMQGTGLDAGPDAYPARATHGRYLADAVREICARNLSRVTIHQWNCRALDIQSVRGRHRIVLEDGLPPVLADAVLLTTGHSAHDCALHDELSGFAEMQAEQGRDKTRFLCSIYPVERRIEPLDKSVRLGILGLGLTSIDGIIAATEGKGGRFERRSDGQLVYQASGNEPKIACWSLPGLPPSARAHNQKGPTFRHPARFLTRDRVDALRDRALSATGTRQLDFQRDVLPLLLLEMEHVYYAALNGPSFAQRYLACAEDPEARASLLAEVDPERRFSWEKLENPLAGRSFSSKDEYTAFLKDYIRQELAEAALGNIEGPLKASTDILRDLRGNIRYVVEFGGLTAASHRWFDREFWPLHNRIAAGPPAIRLEQLLALMEAGILDLSFGPSPTLVPCPDNGCFLLCSQAFPSEPAHIDLLIDGRIAQPNVRTDRSRLVSSLLSRGIIRAFTNATGEDAYSPCGVDITEDHRVIGADGTPNASISALGILCEGTQLYTLVAAAPGVSAKPLMEARDWALRVRELLRGREERARESISPSAVARTTSGGATPTADPV